MCKFLKNHLGGYEIPELSIEDDKRLNVLQKFEKASLKEVKEKVLT